MHRCSKRRNSELVANVPQVDVGRCRVPRNTERKCQRTQRVRGRQHRQFLAMLVAVRLQFALDENR